MSLNLNTLIARARVAVAAGALVLASALASTPAHAVVVPWADIGSDAGVANHDGFPGPSLGDTWNIIGGNSWAITTNGGSTTSLFNLSDVTNSNGNFATAFQYTINSGVVGGIVSGVLHDITTGQFWNAVISAGNQRITFDAPAGSQLSQLDQFTLDINFSSLVDLNSFGFSALWTDAADPSPPPSVPEPGTLSLIGAAALLGLYMMRRRFTGMVC